MSPLAWFIVMKLGLVAAVFVLAFRELALLKRGDTNPEFTRKLVHVFSAAERKEKAVAAARAAAQAPAPQPSQAAPASPPEELRRAA